ncbi:MAG: hypothetical protein ACOY3X_10330 [Pseudomonadota bacterium]
MKIRHAVIAFVAAFAALTGDLAAAADRYEGVNLIRGTVYSVGRADPRGEAGSDNFETGIFVDANYTSVAFNVGIGAKDFTGEQVANVYAGIGFGRIIQLQLGAGTEGTLGRVRTDLNFRSIYNFVTQTRQPRREKTLADRVTFTYAVERYNDSDSEIFDNGTIGIGVLYEGPF